jgi:1-deoxy-D-xylulose-5-phosphate synthase
MRGQKIRRLGIPDHFVEHGSQSRLRAEVGIDKDGIKRAVLEMMRA